VLRDTSVSQSGRTLPTTRAAQFGATVDVSENFCTPIMAW
jgi:hypothetical protein